MTEWKYKPTFLRRYELAIVRVYDSACKPTCKRMFYVTSFYEIYSA